MYYRFRLEFKPIPQIGNRVDETFSEELKRSMNSCSDVHPDPVSHGFKKLHRFYYFLNFLE